MTECTGMSCVTAWTFQVPSEDVKLGGGHSLEIAALIFSFKEEQLSLLDRIRKLGAIPLYCTGLRPGRDASPPPLHLPKVLDKQPGDDASQ